MKIYSLQEENEKMNAARGLSHMPAKYSMFDMNKRSPSAPKSRGAAMSGKPSSVPSGKKQPAPAPGQRPTPQNRKKGSYLGLLIWFIIMLLIFGGNILAQFFGD